MNSADVFAPSAQNKTVFIDEQIHLASVAQWKSTFASVLDVLFCDS